MKDRLKQDVEIGDMVVFNPPNSSDLCIGEIVRITPKGIRVKYKNHQTRNRYQECVRYDFLKINEQYEHAKMTYPEEFL